MPAYTKQTWVPNVTPVDAAHMNHIEDGIVAVDTKPSAAITYIGAYDPAHVYADGDYVIGPDGITYQCVIGGTVGVTPVPWATAPTLPYGTSLPVGPVDGMEAVLVDSTTNPSYQWRFRYNAGSSSAYKWEFIGGTSAIAQVNPDETTTVISTWVDLATDGPTVIVPRAGAYSVTFGCSAYPSAATADAMIAAAVAGVVGGQAAEFTWNVSTHGLSNSNVSPVLTANASDPIKLRYFNFTTGTAHFRTRWINVQPVRVS